MSTKPNIPDLVDGLIAPPPQQAAEMAKLELWLLDQKSDALRDLPVSALGALSEYIMERIQDDRRECFFSGLPRDQDDEDLYPYADQERPSHKAESAVLQNLWPTRPEGEVVVPTIDIPRPAPATEEHDGAPAASTP
jgi:hypothetical protein